MANKATKELFKNLFSVDDALKNVKTPEEQLNFLTDRIDTMQSELKTQTDSLQKVRYENTKLNAQIEVLNKTIDTQNDILNKISNENSELKSINRTLKNNNNHYWRNSFIVSAIVALIFFMLGLLF